MNSPANTKASNPLSEWQQLFEAALLESNPAQMAERFQTAKDAIMDRIEDCFDSASQTERRLLLSALNTISELETVSKPEGLHRTRVPRVVGHAA